MSRKYTVGPDVDLDVDVVLDKKGRRITEERAGEIAADALLKAGVVGRPSLTAPGRHSPEVKARVPTELRDRLHQAAEQRGVSASELVREALDRYLTRN
ncbi:MAG: ribbon-helix-helix domain-containing protein [Actinomycetota bacterium]|nr:ribbon-helix-helix domain-containing protein [Actinomycetota bacterium]